MADLGEFGTELAAVDADPGEADTFRLYGHVFTVRERVSSLPVLRYAYNAQSVVAGEERASAALARARTDEQRAAARRAMAEVELAANAGLYAYLRDMIVPEEWERFEQVAADHGLSDEDLLTVATKIMEAVAGRPTRRSAGSPAGPSPTGVSSTDASASPPPSDPEPDPEEPEGPVLRAGVAVTVVPETVPDPAAEQGTPLQRARDEIRAASPSVRDLVRSGG